MRTMGVAVLLAAVAACIAMPPAMVLEVPDSGQVVVVPPDGGSCNGAVSSPFGPCRCPADCVAGSFCAPEQDSTAPGGVCNNYCDAGAPAPSGYYCFQQVVDATLVATCSATVPCRDGFACYFYPMLNVGLCHAQCSKHSQCTQTGTCDFYSGRCTATQLGAGLAAPCTLDGECKSDYCYPQQGATPRFCYSGCNVRDPACPEGGSCVRISVSPASTAGLCVTRCDGGACNQGFTCMQGNCMPIF